MLGTAETKALRVRCRRLRHWRTREDPFASVWPRIQQWLEAGVFSKLESEGEWSYSFRPPDSICENGAVQATTVAGDAFAAKTYLQGLPFVAKSKIAVVGWSTGGWAIMFAADSFFRDPAVKPFQAAVAFYPMCTTSQRRDTPMLILIGEKDSQWSGCKSRKDGRLKNADYELRVVVYPGAYHLFDYEGVKINYQGEPMEYNPEAMADSISRTQDFLAKHLKASE